VACSPQAWAAATPFALLAASFGSEFDINECKLSLNEPVLPKFLNEVSLRNIRIGDCALDLSLSRAGDDVRTTVLRRAGPVRLTIRK
jgi:glycogen debranching enzyme